MTKRGDPNNPGAGIVGTDEQGAPLNEAENFFTCPACGQAVDMRSLEQLLHHDKPGHKPFEADS